MSDLLRIADQDFSVSDSRLEAFVARDRLCWGFVVQAKSDSPDFEHWEPQLSSDVFTESKSGTLTSWLDLAPVRQEWADRNDTDVCPSASLYVFEHNPVYACSLELQRNSAQLRLSLSGKCDVNYRDDYFGENLSIEVDAAISSLQLLCGKRARTEAEALVRPFLPLEELEFSQDESGVAVMLARYAE
jgi:hypothetical protein